MSGQSPSSEDIYTLTREQILHGLASFVYQFDGYAEYAIDWAEEGFTLFIKGADPDDEFYKDHKNSYDEDDEDEEEE